MAQAREAVAGRTLEDMMRLVRSPRLVAVVGVKQIAPVAGLSSSAAGVFDLSGNLSQWQNDRWSEALSAGVDVQGPASGSVRVGRGGSWFSGPQIARVAYRGSSTPGDRYSNLGFRLLRTAS
jgi:formylglycine-generating enzyme required for sulfatase activity